MSKQINKNQRILNEKLPLWQKSPLLFIKDMWNLEPQPVKPEYNTAVEIIKDSLQFDQFNPDWFEPFQRGRHITHQQWSIFLALEAAIQGKASRRISTTSGHGIGKSCSTSLIVIWRLFCHFNAQVACTAPTSRQLFDVLWKEISLWIKRMPEGWHSKFDCQSTYIRMTESPSTWFASAKTAKKDSTEALAGVHGEHVMVLADEACYDDKTEVLTNNGFKFFKDVSDRDSVLSMNLETNKAIFEKPVARMSYDGIRDMYYYKKRGCDFAVTANHKMVYSTRKVNKNRLKAIKDLNQGGNVYFPRKINFSLKSVDSFTVASYRTRNKVYPELIFDIKDWIELMAWYLSEGCITSGRANSAMITQSLSYNPENAERILSLLDRMELPYRIYGNKDIHLVRRQQVAEELKKYGKSFKNKFIPNYIKRSKHANLFLDVFALGDGYFRKNRRIFYSSSRQMVDDIQEMLYLSGSAGTLSKRKKEKRKWYKDHWIEQRNDAYIVTERQPTKIKFSNNAGFEVKKYEGRVYCVTTHYGNVFTRRNGRCMWSGNSGVPHEVFNTMEGSLTEKDIFVLLFSNPTRLSGYFYDSHNHQKLKKRWQRLQFSNIDSPIVRDDYNQDIIDQHGENSDEYRIRVLGQFPKEDMVDDQGYSPILKKEDIKEIDLPPSQMPEWIGTPRMGVDPAGGGTDEAIWVIRDNFKALIAKKTKKSDKISIARITRQLAHIHKIKPENIFIDSFGVGSESCVELARDNFKINDINVGDACLTDDAKNLYLNRRAENFWRLRKAFKSGFSLYRDKIWKDEVTFIPYRRNTRNRIQIMPKKDIRKNYGRSPDSFDALMMTFSTDDEYTPIKTFTSSQRPSSNPTITNTTYNNLNSAI